LLCIKRKVLTALEKGREAASHSTILWEGLQGLQQITGWAQGGCVVQFGHGAGTSRAMVNKNRGCKRCEVTLPFYSTSTGVPCPSRILRLKTSCGQTGSTPEDVSENHQKSGNHMVCE